MRLIENENISKDLVNKLNKKINEDYWDIYEPALVVQTKNPFKKEEKETIKAFNKFMKAIGGSPYNGESIEYDSGWFWIFFVYPDNSKGTFYWHPYANEGDADIYGNCINNYGLPLEDLIDRVKAKMNDLKIKNELKDFDPDSLGDVHCTVKTVEPISDIKIKNYTKAGTQKGFNVNRLDDNIVEFIGNYKVLADFVGHKFVSPDNGLSKLVQQKVLYALMNGNETDFESYKPSMTTQIKWHK